MLIQLYKKFLNNRKLNKEYKSLIRDFTDSYASKISPVYALYVHGRKYDIRCTGGYKINLIGITPTVIHNQNLVGEYIVIKSKSEKNRFYIAHVIKSQYDYTSSVYSLKSQIEYQDGDILAMFRRLLLQKVDFNNSISPWKKSCGIREAPYATKLIGVIEDNELTTLSEGINRSNLLKLILTYKTEKKII